MLLAGRGYDAGWIRELARQQAAWANVPPKRNRKDPTCFSRYLYRARNLIERFFNKIKQCRRIATDTTSQPTLLRSSNSHQSPFGCVLMSPRSNSAADHPARKPTIELILELVRKRSDARKSWIVCTLRQQIRKMANPDRPSRQLQTE